MLQQTPHIAYIFSPPAPEQGEAMTAEQLSMVEAVKSYFIASTSNLTMPMCALPCASIGNCAR